MYKIPSTPPTKICRFSLEILSIKLFLLTRLEKCKLLAITRQVQLHASDVREGERGNCLNIFMVSEGGEYKGGAIGDKDIHPDYHPIYDLCPCVSTKAIKAGGEGGRTHNIFSTHKMFVYFVHQIGSI